MPLFLVKIRAFCNHLGWNDSRGSDQDGSVAEDSPAGRFAGRVACDSMPRTKQAWRAKARVNRLGLRIDHERVCVGLHRFLAGPRRAGWVVGYEALPGEPDLTALFARPDAGPFALTRTPAEGHDLTLHPADSPRERHRFGFAQPTADAPVVADEDVAVVLVPGLAFDMTGTRLGHGGGYYDRLLARLGPSVWRVGVSDGFIVSGLPRDEHDEAMTHLASEIGVVPIISR